MQGIIITRETKGQNAQDIINDQLTRVALAKQAKLNAHNDDLNISEYQR